MSQLTISDVAIAISLLSKYSQLWLFSSSKFAIENHSFILVTLKVFHLPRGVIPLRGGGAGDFRVGSGLVTRIFSLM